MDKRYQIYYSVHNDKNWAFETDDIFKLDLIIKNFIKECLLNNFYEKILFFVYEGDKLIEKHLYECDYSYM